MEHPHDLTLYVASGAIATAPMIAAAVHRSQRAAIAGAALVSPRLIIASAVGLLSLAAGVIHLVASADHFAESVVAGSLMAAVGWFQMLWPASLLAAPSGRLLLVAGAVNAGTVIVWAASRTTGVPMLGDGGAEPIGTLDLIATVFEVLVVLGVATLVAAKARLAPAAISRRSAILAVAAIALIVIVLTTASISGAAPHHH